MTLPEAGFIYGENAAISLIYFTYARETALQTPGRGIVLGFGRLVSSNSRPGCFRLIAAAALCLLRESRMTGSSPNFIRLYYEDVYRYLA